ncbi:condensation domain-containing protein [Nocardioides zeae]|uniref:Acyl carrier protein n=1 Tax=Nocardioides zeae TaxID=1457234 RepID=A0AAJ1WYN9_9ACTN|nr:condensation domain-containing protein [Nocardioides zeae]MDQ1102848.1 acyl carrier protein [Nocardioides zeae]
MMGSSETETETETETVTAALRDVWSSLLGIDEVRPDDSFFVLGGHSMLAARLGMRATRAIGAEVPPDLVFDSPTFGAWVEAVLRYREALADDETPIVAGHKPAPAPAAARLGPVSLQQEELLSVDRALGPSPINNAVAAVEITKDVDEAVLRVAIDAVVARHPALVAVFDDGLKQMRLPGEQAVDGDQRTIPVEVCALSDVDRVRARVARGALTPFDLGSGPLLRVQWVQRTDDPDILALHAHHAVFDGVSAEIVLDELDRAAAGEALPPEEHATYVDYAVWQGEHQRAVGAEARVYWRDVVRRLIRSGAGLDTDDSAHTVSPVARLHRQLPAEVLHAGRSRFAQFAVTDFALVAGATARAVGRATGRDLVGLGVHFDNRDVAGFERVVGAFATSSVLALGWDVSGPDSDLQLLRSVVEGVAASRRFAHLPLPVAVAPAADEAGVDSVDALVDAIVTVEQGEASIGVGSLGMRRLFDTERPVAGAALSRPPTVMAVVSPSGAVDVVVDHRAAPAAASFADRLADGVVNELYVLAGL